MSPHSSSSPGDLRALESSSVMCPSPSQGVDTSTISTISDIKALQKSYRVVQRAILAQYSYLEHQLWNMSMPNNHTKCFFLGGGPFRFNFYWSLFHSAEVLSSVISSLLLSPFGEFLNFDIFSVPEFPFGTFFYSFYFSAKSSIY